MLRIETNRLVLRDFTPDDLPDYIKLRADDKFKRFYSVNDVTEEKSASLVESFVVSSKLKPRTKFQLAITTKTNTLIGSCGIRIEDNKQASIGCELAREWQKSGYAYEAVRELINYGFVNLKLHRLYAETISENLAAIKLGELLGLRIEAELRENKYFHGRWWNTSILALLSQEWVYDV
jgi:RimJ/RimL family protein N-acetyltransferase